MSTNSLVGYLNEDGSVVTSYVHYDGYATGVGEMLLENYNSDKCARDLASTLGYASSLKETVAASHEDRANSDEPEVFEDYHEFEEYICENSHLEYVYVWDSTKVNGGKWLVATWENTKKKVHNGTCFDYEFESHWNGFEDLTTVYIREGNETVSRWKRMVAEGNLPHEYLDHAKELDEVVTRYNRSAMTEVVEREMACV
jgi:hypothetical protein